MTIEIIVVDWLEVEVIMELIETTQDHPEGLVLFVTEQVKVQIRLHMLLILLGTVHMYIAVFAEELHLGIIIISQCVALAMAEVT